MWGKEAKQGGGRKLASAGFLPGLHFDPEDGGDMFLLNIRLSPNYTAQQPTRLNY
jgi:hypothetical protein